MSSSPTPSGPARGRPVPDGRSRGRRRPAVVSGRGVVVLGLAGLIGALVSCSGDDGGGGDGELGSPVTTTLDTGAAGRSSTSSTSPATEAPATSPAPETSDPSVPTRPNSPPDTPPTTQSAPATLGDPDVEFTHLGDERGQVVNLAAAPGGRLYQVVSSGTVLLTNTDGSVAEVALNISDRTEAEGERGLLSVAISDDGERAYVNYTDSDRDGMTVIAEYAVTDDGTFDPGSARTVMTIEQPRSNHNGGDLRFGPDGYLYVATGDGGGSGDPDRRALDRSSLLGKLLRIDPTGAGDGGEGGTGELIPPDNPFVGEPGARGEIWSYGLRNPWRVDFDDPTGDLWIADVGQNEVEEINVARADDAGMNAGRGTNFGWSAFEGDNVFNDDQVELVGDDHHRPVHTYANTDDHCAVTGAATYHGDRIEGLAGGFVFSDFCSGRVWAIPTDGDDRVVELGSVPSATGVHEIDGELYVTSIQDGLYRVDPAG